MAIDKPIAEKLLKPTRAELLAAVNRRVPDVIAPGLKVLFCGINPGLYSAWSRHHFARPGNRFWPALFASGFTNRLLRPDEEHELLRYCYGITNIVRRPTLAADELTREELVAGFGKLRQKVNTYRPLSLAVLGLSAYRVAFDRPQTMIGRQPEGIGDTMVWVLPNPSGLNAHFTPGALAKLFREFRLALDRL
ncbi:MAG TPA: G/U mismatch-specific DNA glycosylase [Candidatus Limnocylindrales bacterium]|nr:G/U mismatch-specific DNA glycosylase [Candidatus Limnocylindrales bacterium]